MSVDDHGLEVLKKAGVDIKPSTAPKSDYALQSRAKPELFSFIRARRTSGLNTSTWTQIILPVGTERVVFANNENKVLWITSDNTITVGDADGSFPIFPQTTKEYFLKKDGSATVFAATGSGSGSIYVGGESNV